MTINHICYIIYLIKYIEQSFLKIKTQRGYAMTTNYKNLILKKKSLSFEVSQYIKSLIIDGQIKPGDQINIKQIMTYLEISQTPVREAIQHLMGENVVISIRNKGYYVKEYNENDIFEIYSLRAMLEAFAIRLATQRASQNEIDEMESIYKRMKKKLQDDSVISITDDSTKIHDFIFKMSKHERLIQVNEEISFQVAVVNSILGTKYTKKREVEEHKELIEVIKNGNPDEAEKVMRNHIYRSYKNFLKEHSNKNVIEEINALFPVIK
ncbi:MAG TPA: GntR family transcriptional regulator [Candidatus Avamphibacillus sp.]|nr:GntR family transcriptional regulator [Candidatus Avamphibacillus sp.]